MAKTDGIGALLEVEMLKKCTLLWREAHVEVKMHKAPQPRSVFLDLLKVIFYFPGGCPPAGT